MGQGLYDLVGWGVLDPPWHDDPEKNDDLLFACEHLKLKHTSEGDTDYLVIPLAVNGDFLQSWWQLPRIPQWVPRVRARHACRIDATPGQVHALAAACGKDLTALWGHVQRLYADDGLTLPEASLIILNDWD